MIFGKRYVQKLELLTSGKIMTFPLPLNLVPLPRLMPGYKLMVRSAEERSGAKHAAEQ
jgi:hypothetical protein